MYLCISTVVDFNSQNFDPLMKFDKYSPALSHSSLVEFGDISILKLSTVEAAAVCLRYALPFSLPSKSLSDGSTSLFTVDQQSSSIPANADQIHCNLRCLLSHVSSNCFQNDCQTIYSN